MTVDLVQRELPAGANRIREKAYLRIRVGQRVDDLEDIWNIGAESAIDLAFGSFDVRCVDVLVFAVEDDLASVLIGEFDSPPGADCIVVLLRRVDVNPYRR